jgi:hypothetical protein
MGRPAPGRDHIIESGREARVAAKMGVLVGARSHIADEEDEEAVPGDADGKRR